MKIFKFSSWAIIILFFQIFIAPNFTIFGIIPNVLISFSIYLGMELPYKASLSIIFFMGIAYDLVNPNLLGIHTAILLTITTIIEAHHASVKKEKILVVITGLLGINIGYILLILLSNFLFNTSQEFSILKYFLSLLYNFISTFLGVYFLLIMDKMRLKIEI